MKKVVVKKAPKKVQSPTQAPPPTGDDNYFKAVIDPFNAKRNWHLPDEFNGALAEFKQITTVSVTPNDPEEIVVIAGVTPGEGLWIKSQNAPDVQSVRSDAALMKLFEESCRNARERVASMINLGAVLAMLETKGDVVQAEAVRAQIAEMKQSVAVFRNAIVVRDDIPKFAKLETMRVPGKRVYLDHHFERLRMRRNFDTSKPHPMLRYKILMDLLRNSRGTFAQREARGKLHSLAVANSYIMTLSADLPYATGSTNGWWSQAGTMTTAFVASTVRVAPNPVPISGPIVQAFDLAGRPTTLTHFQNAGVAAGRQCVGIPMYNGNSYTVNLDLALDRVPTSPQVILFDDAGNTLTSGTPDADGGVQMTFTATRDGSFTFEYHSTGGNQNLYNFVLAWTDSNPDVDWTQVPTPDAETIVANTTGVRKCAEEVLSTYTGSTLEDGGQAVTAKLPSDYFNGNSPVDINFTTIAALPTHYDGRISDGVRSIQPPYGAQQSIFLNADEIPFDDALTVAPRICQVFKAQGQPFRVRQTTLWEGPSTSQLFQNYARSGDPTALARTGAACGQLAHDSPNFIHLAIIGAACAAWNVACRAWPYVEALAKWTICFGDSVRTVNKQVKSESENMERRRR